MEVRPTPLNFFYQYNNITQITENDVLTILSRIE